MQICILMKQNYLLYRTDLYKIYFESKFKKLQSILSNFSMKIELKGMLSFNKASVSYIVQIF